MDRENILEYLESNYRHLPCYPQLLEYAEKSLKDNLEFQLDGNELGVTIKSIIENAERGTFGLVKITRNPESGDMSIISVRKEYSPQNEVRYGFMTEVGLNMFTDANSAVFDKDGVCTYTSWFSDENKYYETAENQDKDYIMTAIKKTTPKYDSKGKFVEGPESSYRPFTNIQERINNTRVIHRHGRSPINGEYSDVGVIYKGDDGKEKEQYFLKENHGKVYSKGKGWLGSLKEVAKKIESLIDTNTTRDGWSEETIVDTNSIINTLMDEVELDDI